ncbi:MAG: type II secretion system F family protein [Oscillibacter sp.]|nr:type II secretion system F family protein [Oscillibacter sp.]MBQ7681016.1 type II secretion system F family protein [Oscillibacter sp.]
MTESKSRVSEQYLPMFCRELQQMIHSGISPEEGLALLLEDETDGEVRAWLDALYTRTEAGMALSDALRETGAFPEYMADMVSLAEETGRLEDVLDTLCRHYERKLRMRSDIVGAVTTPVVLLAVMIAVVVLLVTQALPVFDRVFVQLGVRMGAVATGMMRAGAALAKCGTAFAVLLAVLVLAALSAALIPSLRTRVAAWFQLRFGGRGVLGQMAVSRFASSMSMAVASGLSMEEAVELSAKLCGGAREIDAKTERCRALILDGKSPADALSGSGLFSGRDCRLLKLAERTGNLPDTLEALAQRQEEESLQRIDRIVAAIEPAVVVITSVLAGTILISVMLPLMGLLSAIG